MMVQALRDRIPRLLDGVEVIALPNGGAVVRRGRAVTLLRDVDADDLRRLLQSVDGRTSLATLIARLAHEYDPEDAAAVYHALDRVVLTFGDDPSSRVDGPRRSVGLLANGRLGLAIAERLESAGFTAGMIAPLAFESCRKEAFAERCRRDVLLSASALLPAPQAAREVDVEALARILGQHELVVCALEGVPFRALLDVDEAARRSRTAVFFVTVESHAVVLGPTVVPGRGVCFECAANYRLLRSAPSAIAEALPLFSAGRVEDHVDASEVERICRIIAHHVTVESSCLFDPARAPNLLRALAEIKVPPEGAAPKLIAIPARPDCLRCTPPMRTTRATVPELMASLAVANDVAAELPAAGSISGGGAPARPVRSVGIIGGGTAGYMTALALRQQLPHLDITLIESSEIPIIGVGEATTPDMLQFLHETLGLDRVEMYKRVQPTWKLGIKFFWGQPGSYSFNYPFGSALPNEALQYSGDFNASNLQAMLMARNLSPVVHDANLGDWSLLKRLRFAYHLDNKRFVRYLQEKAAERGIEHVDVKLVDVITDEAGENVRKVVGADGRSFSYDLFVDCSGFRSWLLEKVGSPFISYGSTLFTDSAVVGRVPHDGLIKPYTFAESMHHGWCWAIPQVEEDHRGYVFSSAFCSVDEAEREMRQRNPRLEKDVFAVKFRSGRHQHFWKGNVVAIGNAYGFVEPLESTGLSMIIMEVQRLIGKFPRTLDCTAASGLNLEIGARWDFIRWFLGLHYRFNKKYDTPFWRECNEKADVSGLEDVLAVYREGGPLGSRADAEIIERWLSDDQIFGLLGVDVLLLGQKVATNMVPPRLSATEWQRRHAANESLTARAMPQRDALAYLQAHPDVLSTLHL